ncbi:MAG: DUF2993 domain-containing protein [Actinomycetota bacterium]|nr:DUF2993 domain-containing protein [Actinomycetota bacterium]
MGVVVVAAVVELVAPSVIEARMEERVRERTREVAGVSAEVDSFPVVTRLLMTGRIRHVTLTLDQVVRQRVTFATVRLTLEGLELDRDVLLRHQEVDPRDIESGMLTAELTAAVLSDLVDAPVELRPGQVSVTLGGTEVTVQPEIRDRTLRLGGRRVTALSLPLPEELATCSPDLVVQLGRLLFSCRLQELPSMLKGASG